VTIENSIRTRRWSKLRFYDPEIVLRELRQVELLIADAVVKERVRTLRTNMLKPHREGREAALLCHGIGKAVLGTTVFVAPGEDEDHDFISLWVIGDTQHYAPVQIKEFVPSNINPDSNLNEIISSLQKYSSSHDLIVGIHINREGSLDISKIDIPTLNIRELWLFGSLTQDQSKWFLIGDLLDKRGYYEFDYPA
jgi:hypothetical protein